MHYLGFYEDLWAHIGLFGILLISCSYGFSTALNSRHQVNGANKEPYGKAVVRHLLHLNVSPSGVRQGGLQLSDM